MLPFDLAAKQRCAEAVAQARSKAVSVGVGFGFIAATGFRIRFEAVDDTGRLLAVRGIQA